MTNRQQRRICRLYDEWSAKTRRDLNQLARNGGSVMEQEALLERRMVEFERKMQEVYERGIEIAANASAGSRKGQPVIQGLIAEEKAQGDRMIHNNLIPLMMAPLVSAIAMGAAFDGQQLQEAFGATRAMPPQYAGGAWVMIFKTQRTLGEQREHDRALDGLKPEPVRWVLDPQAEHCADSAGYHGCPSLAGEYPSWKDLPTLPAGQVTCRGNCILPGSNISAEGIEIGYRMMYSGPAIELRSESGMRLAVTPGHHILTPHGWVSAQHLNKGNDIISGDFGNRILSIGQENQHMPALIEEVWRALNIPSRQYYPTITMAAAQDFHGDGRFVNGQVDIVFANSHLWRNSYASLAQVNSEFPLIGSFRTQGSLLRDGSLRQIGQTTLDTTNCLMTSSDLMRSLIWGHFSPLQLFSLAPPSNNDTSINQAIAQCPSADAKRGSNCQFRFSRLISRDSACRNEHILSIPSPAQTQAVTVTPRLDAVTLEQAGESNTAYTRILRYFAERHAGHIFLDKLIDIRRFDYTGHVFDLQTQNGCYFSSTISQPQCTYQPMGFLLSNCRCHLEVFRDGQWQRGVYGS